jgi:flagellar protein FlaG
MALDVSSIQTASPIILEGLRHAPIPAGSNGDGAPKTSAEVPNDFKAAVRDIQRVSDAFNRRLSFSINEKLGQVIVKVIDIDTDKVVREIPSTELQHVYERIREMLGLLVDKSA